MAQVKPDDEGAAWRHWCSVWIGEAADFWEVSESMARCWSNWILVAPTVMAMAMVSLSSSSVAPSSLATARQ